MLPQLHCIAMAASGITPARLLPSHLVLSVGRLALRGGVQHVVHLPRRSRGRGHSA